MFRSRIIAVLLAATLGGSVAHAETIVIDDATAGSVYDGLLDGSLSFSMGPPTTIPANGTADTQGAPLAIALAAGGIEQRGIAELPLARLAGVGAADVVSATLTVTIDDVIPLFWPFPGGMFTDNAAASTIDVYTYSGDGVVQAAGLAPDFALGALAGTINTGPAGSITDASLLLSGPLTFTLDVTTQLQGLLGSSATHMGFNLRTTDAGTGTSLDNAVGFGAGRMPSLTVVTAVAALPNFDSTARTCEKALAIYGRKFAAAVQANLGTCLNRVLKDTALAKPLTSATTSCAKALDIGAVTPSKVDKARTKALAKIVAKCPSPLTPASVNSPCDATAATFTDVGNCILDHHFDKAQEMVRADFADSCALADAVGIDAEYPVLCLKP